MYMRLLRETLVFFLIIFAMIHAGVSFYSFCTFISTLSHDEFGYVEYMIYRLMNQKTFMGSLDYMLIIFIINSISSFWIAINLYSARIQKYKKITFVLLGIQIVINMIDISYFLVSGEKSPYRVEWISVAGLIFPTIYFVLRGMNYVHPDTT